MQFQIHYYCYNFSLSFRRNCWICAYKLPKGWNIWSARELYIETLLQGTACEFYIETLLQLHVSLIANSSGASISLIFVCIIGGERGRGGKCPSTFINWGGGGIAAPLFLNSIQIVEWLHQIVVLGQRHITIYSLF